jgi:hypothetical protein
VNDQRESECLILITIEDSSHLTQSTNEIDRLRVRGKGKGERRRHRNETIRGIRTEHNRQRAEKVQPTVEVEAAREGTGSRLNRSMAMLYPPLLSSHFDECDHVTSISPTPPHPTPVALLFTPDR